MQMEIDWIDCLKVVTYKGLLLDQLEMLLQFCMNFLQNNGVEYHRLTLQKVLQHPDSQGCFAHVVVESKKYEVAYEVVKELKRRMGRGERLSFYIR